MKTRKNLGVTSVLVLLLMFVALTAMLALAGLSMTAVKRANNEAGNMQTFQVAQSLLEYQTNLSYQASKSKGGNITGGTFYLNDLASTLTANATGYVTVVPTSDNTRAWVTSYATYGGKSRSVRMLIKTKDVSIWNNAIFAGTGAAGQSINGNVDIRGSVHILGEGEPYSDLNGNGKWDKAETYTDTNKNGVWDPGEPFVDANNDGVWNSAEPYNDTNFNNMYDPPLTTTDLNTSLGGTAHIGNNYLNMPASLLAMIPSAPTFNGMQTLSAEVRAAHGKISISGSATVGDSSNPNPGMKGKLDGTFVSDGWTGNQGSSSVFSDNGYGNSYDLGSLGMTFPIISGIGAQDYTDVNGTVWSNMQTYYNSQAMTIPVNSITSSTAAFTYLDLKGNSISYTPQVKVGNVIVSPPTLTVTGIVKVVGNLAINGQSELRYAGKGTLYATQDVYIGNNLLPKSGLTFPTSTSLGIVAGRNMGLATGNGDSQLSMAGAFYAQGTITSAKQNQIAGTFVANYFDMGQNVPNIYQVPSLKDNLPPGMPGDQPYITIKIKSWRDRR